MTDATAYTGRTVFVTGASGIVGSWLVRELIAGGASVVALLRDDDPRSELIRSGDVHRITGVRGSLEDAALLDRAIVQYEVDVVFHLGAQTQVRHAQRHPFDTLEAKSRLTRHPATRPERGPHRPTRPLGARDAQPPHGTTSPNEREPSDVALP
jgi:CDP-glucose 4,6-dehydratase